MSEVYTGPLRVQDALPGADGEVRLVTDQGIAKLGVQSLLQVVARFDPAPGVYPIQRACRGQECRYAVETGSSHDTISIYGEDGRLLKTTSCPWCLDLTTVHVSAHEEAWVIRGSDKAIKVFDIDGAPLAEIPMTSWSRYLMPVVTAAEPHALAVVVGGLRGQKSEPQVTVTSLKGDPVARWELPAGTSSCGVHQSSLGRMVCVVVDAIEQRDATTGDVLARVSVAESSSFRTVEAAALSPNHTLYVLSGGGYLNAHAVIIVDGTGRVVYQRAAEGRTWAVMSRAPDAVWVSAAKSVTAYSLKVR